MVVVVGVFVAVVVVLNTKTQLVPLVLTCGRNGFGDNSKAYIGIECNHSVMKKSTIL